MTKTVEQNFSQHLPGQHTEN